MFVSTQVEGPTNNEINSNVNWPLSEQRIVFGERIKIMLESRRGGLEVEQPTDISLLSASVD